MTLIGLLIVLLIIGVVMALVPVDPTVKRIIWIILAVLLVVWILAAFGLLGGDIGFYPRERVIVR